MSDQEQLWEAVQRAKVAHAAALIAHMEDRGSQSKAVALREAERAGRNALRAYRQVAMAPLIAEIDALAPAAFREE